MKELRRPRVRESGARKAFTLIELLVVIAILALLVAIITPVLNQVVKKARIARTQDTIMQVAGTLIIMIDEQRVMPTTDTTAFAMTSNACNMIRGYYDFDSFTSRHGILSDWGVARAKQFGSVGDAYRVWVQMDPSGLIATAPGGEVEQSAIAWAAIEPNDTTPDTAPTRNIVTSWRGNFK